MIKKNILVTSIYFICFSTVIAITSLFKFNYIFGSTASFFHGSTILLPLSGFWFGSSGAAAYFFMRALLKFVMGSSTFLYVLYHVPSFCGALYWTVHSGFFRIGFPLSCMIAFVMHPEGFNAAPYALFWVVPMVVYSLQLHGTFWQALSSTFIAHAAGSIIWLYTMHIPASMWLALIPVVAVERIICALGMVLAIRLVEKVRSKMSTLRSVGTGAQA